MFSFLEYLKYVTLLSLDIKCCCQEVRWPSNVLAFLSALVLWPGGAKYFLECFGAGHSRAFCLGTCCSFPAVCAVKSYFFSSSKVVLNCSFCFFFLIPLLWCSFWICIIYVVLYFLFLSITLKNHFDLFSHLVWCLNFTSFHFYFLMFLFSLYSEHHVPKQNDLEWPAPKYSKKILSAPRPKD